MVDKSGPISNSQIVNLSDQITRIPSQVISPLHPVVMQIAAQIISDTPDIGLTMAAIERLVPGFKSNDGEPSVEWRLNGELMWDGLSEAGAAAMDFITTLHLVAIAPSHAYRYQMDGRMPGDPDWVAFKIVPVKRATFLTPKFLLCVSEAMIIVLMDEAVKRGLSGYRPLNSIR